MHSQTTARSFRLGFIGGGKLAGSVLRGLIRARYCPASAILVSEPDPGTRHILEEELGISGTAENSAVAATAEIVLVGVKPAVVLPVLAELASQLERKLVISLAAGVRTGSMEKVAAAQFMRAMTNTPSSVCTAATALARGGRTTAAEFSVAREIFGAIGVAVEVTEEQIDAVTALAGSGPAFVYTVIEALAEGGKKMGLTADVALALATQTVLGAAKLAQETRLSPEALRKMVVTPGGTTAAGLAAMDELQTSRGLIAAVEAAARRGAEMAQENS
ncbi:MAG TPA: pyrroline-5-carboxylate reductase [Chthoniobacterales bacterium]|jgi:pyrroline-5-carboxylate reductase|nr:pyrroline-5-carboxylate reductase [Chthoniobacterales bacterium]